MIWNLQPLSYKSCYICIHISCTKYNNYFETEVVYLSFVYLRTDKIHITETFNI